MKIVGSLSNLRLFAQNEEAETSEGLVIYFYSATCTYAVCIIQQFEMFDHSSKLAQ